MQITNHRLLERMLELVVEGLDGYCEQAFRENIGSDWRARLDLNSHKRLDAYRLLKLMQSHWRTVFSPRFGDETRAAVNAVLAGRNAYAHRSADDVDDHVTLRALSGAAQLLQAVSALQAAEAKRLYEHFLGELGRRLAAAPTPPASDSSARARRSALTPVIRFEPETLRQMLTAAAERRSPLSYSDVGRAVGHARWTQGHTVALTTGLILLAKENEARAEPLLMALVVSKTGKNKGLPGAGFFAQVPGVGSNRERHERELQRIYAHSW